MNIRWGGVGGMGAAWYGIGAIAMTGGTVGLLLEEAWPYASFTALVAIVTGVLTVRELRARRFF